MSDLQLPPLDDQPGPARKISPAEAQRLIRGTLELYAPRRRFARWPAIAAAVTFALVASSATAAWWVAQRAAPEVPSKAKSARGPVEAPPPATEEAPSALEEEERVPETPVATEDLEDEAPAVKDVAPGPRRRRLKTPRPQPPSERPGLAPGGPSAHAAADLLAEANALRAAQDYAAARQRYLQVPVRFVGSPSAYVAYVAAAALSVDHLGRPGEAVTAYRQALALDGKGPLDLEIRLGLIKAYRAQGQEDAELDAAADFLERYPKAKEAAQVRRRMALIQGTP